MTMSSTNDDVRCRYHVNREPLGFFNDSASPRNVSARRTYNIDMRKHLRYLLPFRVKDDLPNLEPPQRKTLRSKLREREDRAGERLVFHGLSAPSSGELDYESSVRGRVLI